MAEGLDGRPVEEYERMLSKEVKDGGCGNNLRAGFQKIQSGEMLKD
jgi:hypothetical protein